MPGNKVAVLKRASKQNKKTLWYAICSVCSHQFQTKQKMKAIKLLIILTFLTFSGSLFAQGKSLVYVHIQENISTIGIPSFASYMTIAFPNEAAKTIELNKLQSNGAGAEDNAQIIRTALEALVNQGYEIISQSVGSDMNVATTKIVLVKE